MLATHVEHRQCTQCKRSCPLSMLTKNSTILKTCITCRDDNKKRYEKKLRDDEGYRTMMTESSRRSREKRLRVNPEEFRQKQRESGRKRRMKMLRENPDAFRKMMNESNRRYREKKLHEDPDGFRRLGCDRQKARRRRQIAANPDEFYAHQRDKNNKRFAANKETILERSRLSVPNRLRSVKNGAKQREYEWSIDDDAAMGMILGPCFFCGILAVDCVHGLDRLDNCRGYTPDNTVGCCGECNMMKKCIDARTFLQRCVHICGLEKHPAAWPDTTSGNLYTYRHDAKRKQRAFEITKEAYDELVNQPCVYCRRDITETNRSGIDRIDNDLGYVSGNMQPCCSECNVMRGALTVDAFLEKASRIAARAELLLIPEMPACLTAVTRRKRKEIETAAPTKKTRARTGDAP